MTGPLLDPDAMPPEELERLRSEGLGGLVGKSAADREAEYAASGVVAYQFVGPIKRGDGWCVTTCDYDEDGVCRRCECFDPERFIVIEYPSEQQDAQREMVERLQAAGIEVRRV